LSPTSYQVFIAVKQLYSLSFEPNSCPTKITEFCHSFHHGCAGISTLGTATPSKIVHSDLTKWALNGKQKWNSQLGCMPAQS